jgi:IS5 family transposase
MRAPEDNQVRFEDLAVEKILEKDKVFRPMLEMVNFHSLMKRYQHIYSEIGAPGYPIESGIKCLLVQIIEDRSDRQMEELVRDSIRVRYFCGFSLADQTPDHSFFGRFRERLGVENVKDLFNYIVRKLKRGGLVGGFCSFIDTSDVVRKRNTWAERDKKIEEEMERLGLNRDLMKKEPPKKKTELKREKGLLNNSNVAQYSSDPDAMIGCKGKGKYWFGYKRGVCVDGKCDIVTAVEVKPANVMDHRFALDLLPEGGAVLMDKGFDVDELRENIPDNVAARIIKKRNRKDKNYDLDRWISSIRSPFEAIFSHLAKRTRFVGLAKNQFKGFIEAIAHNLKKALRIRTNAQGYWSLCIS